MVPFSSHSSPRSSGVTVGRVLTAAHMLISVLFAVFNCLIGTCCLSHCPNVLISIHNILRKERASIFCALFSYLLFHIQDYPQKKEKRCPTLICMENFGWACCQTFQLISTFSPSCLSSRCHYFFSPFCLLFLAFFHNYFRAPYLYPNRFAL